MNFVQARYYTPGRIERVRLLVVHDMETDEKTLSVAENVASWFASSGSPQASAHRCIDRDSVVGSVRLSDTAWHAPGANADGVGYELAGRASQGPREWRDVASEDIIENAARIMARDSLRLGIRARVLDDDELRDGRTSGITTHRRVSQVFRQSDHYDPGEDFPMGYLLERVQHHRARLTDDPDPAPKKPADVVPISDGPAWPYGPDDYLGTTRADKNCHSGVLERDRPAVIRWQRRMASRGWRIKVDGTFGDHSAEVAHAFAQEHKLGTGEKVTRHAWHAAWREPIR